MEHTKETINTNKTASTGHDSQVTPLRELKAVKLSGTPDFRGWKVKLGDGQSIGTVDRLFVDKAGHELRYFEVKIDTKLIQPTVSSAVNMLIPVGRGQLDAKDDIVTLPTLNRANFIDVPKMPTEIPSQSFEVVLAKWFGAKTPAQNLYAGDVFDLHFLTAKRPTSAADATTK